MIFDIRVYLVKAVFRMQINALPCWPFGLSPLNELNRGKLVRSVTLIPLEIF